MVWPTGPPFEKNRPNARRRVLIYAPSVPEGAAARPNVRTGCNSAPWPDAQAQLARRPGRRQGPLDRAQRQPVGDECAERVLGVAGEEVQRGPQVSGRVVVDAAQSQAAADDLLRRDRDGACREDRSDEDAAAE